VGLEEVERVLNRRYGAGQWRFASAHFVKKKHPKWWQVGPLAPTRIDRVTVEVYSAPAERVVMETRR